MQITVRIERKRDKPNDLAVNVPIQKNYTIRQVLLLYRYHEYKIEEAEHEERKQKDLKMAELAFDYEWIETMKLALKEQILAEDKYVYEYPRIQQGTVLHVIQPESHLTTTNYKCITCGHIVTLTKTDDILCPNCFSRIVEKQRTLRPCKYLCQ